MQNPDDSQQAGPARLDMRAPGFGVSSAVQVGWAAPNADSGARDFDFLIGCWTVKHRKLASRLSRSSDWYEFSGTLHVRPILHGLGNVDENVLDDPEGRYLASSLRVFDRRSGLWSVYWVDGRTSGIDKPVIGRFEGRTGRFYNDDQFEDRPIKIRFTYRDLGARRASWEQAFSEDDGRTWEPNWTMDFARQDSVR